MKYSITTFVLVASASVCPSLRAQEAPAHSPPASQVAPPSAAPVEASSTQAPRAGSSTPSDATAGAGQQREPGEFYLGLRLALGASNASDETTELSGTYGGGALQLGISLTPSLAVFAEGNFGETKDPDVRSGDFSGTAEGTSVSTGGLGVGATYYVTPYDIYVGGVISRSSMSIEVEGDESDESEASDSAAGLGLLGRVGKDFWVSESWALGIGLEFQYLSVEYDDGPAVDHHSISAAFSGTYN